MNKKPITPVVFFVFGFIFFIALLILIGQRAGYYVLPLSERALHPAHATLRSSGKWGLSFGVAGTILVFLNLTYLIRKKVLTLEWLGSLRSWMAFHVFTGLVGAALVLLHAVFFPRSALGTLAYVGLLVVVFTGLIGRYIYAHTPRSMEGRELELDEIQGRLEGYRQQLEKWGVPAHDLTIQIPKTAGVVHDQGILSAILGLLVGNREARKSFNQFRNALHEVPALKSMTKVIFPLAKKYYQESQWLARYSQLRSLMSSWRFFHRWFAITMLAAVLFHILIAYFMGDLWIFRG